MNKVPFIYFGLIFLLFCDTREKGSSSSTFEGAQELQKMHLIETSGTIPSFELWADKVISKEDTTILVLFKVFFYDSTGTKIAELQADSGWIYENTLDLLSRGNVVLFREDGAKLQTQELLWIEKEKKVKGNKKVKLFEKDNVVEGEGIVSDAGLKEFRILGRVKGGKSENK